MTNNQEKTFVDRLREYPEEQFIIFCPVCDMRRPDSMDLKKLGEELAEYECCNKGCDGEWGTGCYHCHHPSFTDTSDGVYKIYARSELVNRRVGTYVWAGSYGQAVLKFTAILRDLLMVAEGSRWTIEVKHRESEPAQPAYYTHYMTDGITYQDPITVPDNLDPTSGTTPEPKKRMTREEARLALEAYFRQELEAEALYLIEAVVNGLVEHPDREVRVVTQGWDLAFPRHASLKNMTNLELGQVKGPAWLSRFKGLIEEIRTEHDLHDPESSDDQEPSV